MRSSRRVFNRRQKKLFAYLATWNLHLTQMCLHSLRLSNKPMILTRVAKIFPLRSRLCPCRLLPFPRKSNNWTMTPKLPFMVATTFNHTVSSLLFWQLFVLFVVVVVGSIMFGGCVGGRCGDDEWCGWCVAARRTSHAACRPRDPFADQAAPKLEVRSRAGS